MRDPEGPSATRPFVVFDLELTITDGSDPPACIPRPGIREWLTSLRLLGFDTKVWSRAHLPYSLEVLETLGLNDLISGVHEKPRWEEGERITRAQTTRILGGVPVLQVDDWPDEAVEGVPFMLVARWTGDGFEEGPLEGL